ncbi:hypothetical protein BLA29_003719 [Euroglyphus maynei]|uniref:Myosin motor domain-containing protein n=1 Tax=Euroglyphus maynei TaxID=6958 RepID=A0A1Y3B4B3_EURMA|nr:hypothetical protein BLA29_003719 [Euroglyphus maynei]
MEMYRTTTTTTNTTTTTDKRPHIFAVANLAYRIIFEQNTGCSIIVTGESGSGKTEASKLLLLFLSHVFRMNNQQQPSLEIENVVDIAIKSNCILESFGNAMTICNDNSSRFGKFSEISFVRDDVQPDDHHQNYHYSFGTIHDYLLEKCRVIGQQEGERNFHCFYQMLSVLNSQKYGHLFFEFDVLDIDVNSYDYLNGSSKSQIHTQDELNFEQVFDSMLAIGFDYEEIRSIYKVLAAILVLGNIRFTLLQQCSDEEFGDYKNALNFLDREFLEKFCQFLSLDFHNTLLTLCSRLIRTPNESVRKSYDHRQAIQSRDAMAKALYNNLFGYILKRINVRLKLEKERTVADDDRPLRIDTIGILDIYGFEVFEKNKNGKNGFEQFMINYSNEKLHQLFIDSIMKKEQSLYEQEDICWKKIDFEDHQVICQIYRGIFAILDEICATVGTHQHDDSRFLKFLGHHFKDDRHFRIQKDDFGFIINHFDGEVQYTIDGFVEKNLNQLYHDHYELIQTTTNPFVEGKKK